MGVLVLAVCTEGKVISNVDSHQWESRWNVAIIYENEFVAMFSRYQVQKGNEENAPNTSN